MMDSSSYYNILEVSQDATPEQIRKAYLHKAKRWHPDKNQGDPNAEVMFKKISQAYSVLSDERKRRIYDAHGEEGVKAHEEGGEMDYKELFKSLFGAGKFDDIFDDIFYTDIMINSQNTGEVLRKEYDARFQAECKRYSQKLNEKIQPFVDQNHELFKNNIQLDIEDKVDSPGGPELLVLIGYVYMNEAQKHKSSFLGLGKFGASIKENAKWLRANAQTFGDAYSLQVAAHELEEDPNNERAQATYFDKGLSVIWRLGKLEIERLVRGSCKLSLKDRTQTKGIIKERLKAIKLLGKMYKTSGSAHLQKRRLDELRSM